jgi:hypothetical protein
MKPKHDEKPKEEVKGMVIAVVEFRRCCWVLKSNRGKEDERKNKKWERREGPRPSRSHRKGIRERLGFLQPKFVLPR